MNVQNRVKHESERFQKLHNQWLKERLEELDKMSHKEWLDAMRKEFLEGQGTIWKIVALRNGAYQCTSCGFVNMKEEEVICKKCGKGEMVYVKNE